MPPPPLHASEVTKSSGQATVPQEILILNSYHPGYAWSDDEQAGIIAVFRAKNENRLPVIEYLDLKRLPDGSTVINHPLSFYATHRTVIQTTLGIIGFLLIVVSLLAAILILRRRGAVALRRSEENFRNSLDDSPLGVRIVTEEGETLYANRAILDIYDYDNIEELKTTPVERRYTPESQAEFEVRREKRKQGGNVPSEYEVSIVRKDGEFRNLQVFRKSILWDGKKQFQVIYKDITDRKQAEEALRESELLFRKVFEEHAAVKMIIDPDTGTIIDANKAAVVFYGWSSEKLKQMKIQEINTLSPEEVKKEMEKAINHKKVHFEFHHRRADGSVRDVDVFSGKIQVNKKNFLHSIIYDITERKRAEEKLQVSRKRLRALAGRLQKVREEERTQIAREIHDELGGALTGLKIDFSQLKRNALKIENEAVRASLLADIDPMIKFTDATIHTVRRIAMELRPGVLDDLGLVAALEWLLGDFQKRTGIRCKWISSVEYIELDSDLSTALFRIVQESLTNVARHSGATEVRVHLRADPDSFILEIKDNGTGMEKEKLMDPTSLGLLGMRERALMFGGSFRVKGTPRTGTTVTVEIPPAEKRKMDRDQKGDAG